MLDTDQSRIISHQSLDNSFETTYQKTQSRIVALGDKPHVSVEKQLALLDQLSQFSFGRFLLQNRGINGYWTHAMLTHPWHRRNLGIDLQGKPLTPLEQFILDKAPSMQATQERFQIFLEQNQTMVYPGAVLACVPCGLMGELLYLQYDEAAKKTVRLVGVDFDAETLIQAEQLAEQQALSSVTHLLQCDAWSLNINSEWDLISSNGLNIYEPDTDQVIALWHQFYAALKPNGRLVTSFLTPPPTLTKHCEWRLSQLNPNDLLLQQILFMDIIDAKFQCYSTSEVIKSQLASVGFKDITIIYDSRRMFPTVIATK